MCKMFLISSHNDHDASEIIRQSFKILLFGGWRVVPLVGELIFLPLFSLKTAE